MRLRLIFPHQLFSRLQQADEDAYLYVKHPLFYTQFPFHVQKLILHEAGIAEHQNSLCALGRRTHCLEPDDCTSPEQFAASIRRLVPSPTALVVYDLVDDYLERDVRAVAAALAVPLHVENSPGFLCSLDDLADYARKANLSAKRRLSMADFYTWQRRRLDVLLTPDGSPAGGQWSLDAENRKPLPAQLQAPAAHTPSYTPTQREVIARTALRHAGNPGSAANFAYPVSEAQAKELLEHFLCDRFRLFGDFEDAIHPTDGVLFHSQLSSSLNCGLLEPGYVLERTLQVAAERAVPLNSVEGFVRQVIGWREFMRATYEWRGGAMRTRNFFGFSRPVPEGFWNAGTGLAPVDAVLARLHDTAYAHHIERLMMLGCVLLLAETDPAQVYEWFMSLFIDAYDWVMVPNVYAMSQYADGGTITSKPYLCGSSYIRKMGRFKSGEWYDVWDGLYWRFIAEQRALFSRNPRTAMSVRSLDNLDPDRRDRIISAAADWMREQSER